MAQQFLDTLPTSRSTYHQIFGWFCGPKLAYAIAAIAISWYFTLTTWWLVGGKDGRKGSMICGFRYTYFRDCMSKNSPLRITLCQFRVSLELAIEATFQLKDLEISLFRLWLTRSRVTCARSKSAYSHLLLCWAFRSDNETWADGATTVVTKSWGLFLLLLVVLFLVVGITSTTTVLFLSPSTHIYIYIQYYMICEFTVLTWGYNLGQAKLIIS